MNKTNTDVHVGKLCKQVAFVKEWRDDALCFIFHGASRKIIGDTFRSLEAMCRTQVTTEPVQEMTNGRCHRNIIVRISTHDMHTIQEDELAEMVIHLLKKKHCEATLFSDYQKFLNT